MGSDVLRRFATRVLVTAALCTSAGCAITPGNRPANSDWPRVASELLAMRGADQALRNRVLAGGSDAVGDPKLIEQMRALDRRHTKRLEEIVAAHGWPRRSQVGPEAASAAWLLAQHADQDPAFQAHVLELLEPLVETGEVAPPDFALLTDRVRVAQGRPQLYGTQYLTMQVDGVWYHGLSTPVEDPERLDEHRARMGLWAPTPNTTRSYAKSTRSPPTPARSRSARKSRMSGLASPTYSAPAASPWSGPRAPRRRA
jgi:hypothetical protein